MSGDIYVAQKSVFPRMSQFQVKRYGMSLYFFQIAVKWTKNFAITLWKSLPSWELSPLIFEGLSLSDRFIFSICQTTLKDEKVYAFGKYW